MVKGRLRLEAAFFSGAVTALQLPLLGKDFHDKNNEKQYVN